jgi:ATP-dependent RNA helicase DeaD
MTQFQALGLSEPITESLISMGYEKPTPIQQITIPQILGSNQDLKAFAQTGTGKTAAFSLPIIEKINRNKKHAQALILSPTRELAIQIARNIEEFSQNMKDLKVTAVYGGANIDQQIRSLRQGSHIVVGTPGRTLDLVKRKALSLDLIEWLVLDEADEMLNMGFKEELDKILRNTPAEKQTLLFSATFPKEVEQISRNYLREPLEVSAGQKNTGAANVEHEYYLVSDRNRYPALKRIADVNPSIYGIVFCRTRRETKDVADKLIADGYNADALHGDLSQAQRDLVMNKFRKKHLQMLVATDVAARGLDVDDLSHVIHYKLPDQIENYTHRSGRTGRAGKKGISVAVITNREKNKIRPIEGKIKKKFVQKQVPSGQEICEVQLFSLIDKIHDIEVNEKEIKDFLPDIFQKLDGLDRKELIKRFVSIEFNQFLSYYENSRDLNGDDRPERKKPGDASFVRFYINQGKMDNLTPARLMGLINECIKKRDVEIGRIEILKSFSFFEIDKSFKEDVLGKMNGAIFNDRPVNVEVTSGQKKTGSRDKRGKWGRKNSKSQSDFPYNKKRKKNKRSKNRKAKR